MTELSTATSSFYHSINAIVHMNQFRLAGLQLFPVFIGRICEILTYQLAYMHTLYYVDSVQLTDVIILFAVQQLFCFHLTQALWEICQVRVAKCIIEDDPIGAKRIVMPLCGATTILIIVLLCVFYPVGNALGKSSGISSGVRVYLLLTLAIGFFLYCYTFGYQNLYQVENRQLMILSVRVITCIISALIDQLFVISAARRTYSLPSCVSQTVSFLFPLVWLFFWNSGKSVLNVRNKTTLTILPSDFIIKKGLSQFGKESAIYLFGGILNIVQHFSYSILTLAAVKTMRKFGELQSAFREYKQAELYVFYIFGEYFRAISFAVSQVHVFDSQIYIEKKMFTKINKMVCALLFYGLIVNVLLLVLAYFSGFFQVLSGENDVLLAYISSQKYRSTVLKAFLLGLGDIFSVMYNNYLIFKRRYLYILIIGVGKIVVALVTILQGYKYQFQKLDILSCYICSELVGILNGVLLVFWNMVENLMQQKKVKKQ